jgi:hypothetical protein
MSQYDIVTVSMLLIYFAPLALAQVIRGWVGLGSILTDQEKKVFL